MWPLRKSRQSNRGFTLVELLIVVVIIGILAAMAIPRFNMAAHESKEKEADILLKQVYKLQQTYYANNGTYADDATALTTVGFESPGPLKYYSWSGAVGTFPICLAADGPWNDRQVDAQGQLEDGSC